MIKLKKIANRKRNISQTKIYITKFRMEIFKRFISPEVLNVDLHTLKLSARTLNQFKKSGFAKVDELLFLSDTDLLRIKGIGQKSLVEFFTEIERISIIYKEREPTLRQLRKIFLDNLNKTDN